MVWISRCYSRRATDTVRTCGTERVSNGGAVICCSKLTWARQCRIIKIEAYSYIRAATFGTAELGRGAV